MAKRIVHSEKVLVSDGSIIVIREKHLGSGNKHYWARVLGVEIGKAMNYRQQYKAIARAQKVMPCLILLRQKHIMAEMANLPPATPDGGGEVPVAMIDDDGGVEAPVFDLPEPAST